MISDWDEKGLCGLSHELHDGADTCADAGLLPILLLGGPRYMLLLLSLLLYLLYWFITYSSFWGNVGYIRIQSSSERKCCESYLPTGPR